MKSERFSFISFYHRKGIFYWFLHTQHGKINYLCLRFYLCHGRGVLIHEVHVYAASGIEKVERGLLNCGDGVGMYWEVFESITLRRHTAFS